MYFVKIAQCRKNKGDFGYIAKNNPTFEYSDLLKDGFKGYLKELGYDIANDDMVKMIED